MDKVNCEYCEKKFSKYGIHHHINRKHLGKPPTNENKKPWNLGLTKETDKRVERNGLNAGKALKGKKQGPLKEEHKRAISRSMRLAHKEGRAHNIGMSRWNNEPSYPEKFFMKVIENEFLDKDYKREHNVSIYSIDFAWLDKKKAIEIDGDQHQRFIEYIERDKRKDVCLRDNGWSILRIVWVDMYNDPKHYIRLAKEFIES